MLNILINAREAIKRADPPEPLVSIETQKEKEYFIIVISNNGEHLSKSKKEIIFEKYYSTKKISSGIGLYISRMIIKRHFNGEVWANSDNEKTSFYISIPFTH